MSRSRSGRGGGNIYGDTSKEKVRAANTMVARMIVLLMFIEALGALWFLEQPQSSLMLKFPPFQILGKDCLTQVFFRMAAYGADTLKPTWVASSSDFVSLLKENTERLCTGPQDFACR